MFNYRIDCRVFVANLKRIIRMQIIQYTNLLNKLYFANSKLRKNESGIVRKVYFSQVIHVK